MKIIRQMNDDYNIMEDIYSVSHNTRPLQILTESSLNRIINGHDEDGYCIISASRSTIEKNGKEFNGQELVNENNIRTKELKQAISREGYSYVPVYGGYKENEASTAVIEKSFIVFPYKRDKHVEFSELVDFMIEQGKKFEQESILIKEPNKNPRYFNIDSNSYDDYEFTGNKINDVTQQYFTALKGWSDNSLNRSNHDWKNGSPQRYTLECFLNPSPCSLSEAHIRRTSGELFVM